MSEPVDIVVNDGIAPSIVPTLQEIAENARTCYSALATLQDALNEIDAGAMSQLSQSTQGASSQLKDAANSQTTLTGATKETTAATSGFTSEMKKAEAATAAAKVEGSAYTSVLGGLKSALAFVGIGLGVKYFIDQADGYSKIIDKLKDVSSSYEDLVAKEGKLFSIAQNTRQSFESTTSIFVGLAKATAGTAVTQAELFSSTELLDKALTSSGKSADVVSGALRTFTSGLTSGRTAGMAMRSLLLEFPHLGKAVATGLNMSATEFVKAAQAGKITIEQFITGLNNSAKTIEDKFGRTTVTVASTFKVLEDAVGRFIGQTNEASSVTAALANTILFAASHVEVLAGIVGIVAVRFAAMLAINTVTFFIGLATSAVAATVSMIAFIGPVGLVVAAVVAAGVAVGYFTGLFDGLTDKTKSFGDAVKTAINDRIKEAVGAFKEATDQGNTLSGTLGQLANDAHRLDSEFGVLGKSALSMGKNWEYLDKTAKELRREYIEMEKHQAEIVTGLMRMTTGTLQFENAMNTAADVWMKYNLELSETIKKHEEAAASASALAHGFDNIAVSAARAGSSASAASEISASSLASTSSSSRGSSSSASQTQSFSSVTDPFKDRSTQVAIAKFIAKGGDPQDAYRLARYLSDNILSNTAMFGINPWAKGGDGTVNPQYLASFFKKNPDLKDVAGSLGFANGGEFEVGGSGPVDSQLVKFWASPDETVTVETPQQRAKRLRESGDTGGRISIGTVKIEVTTKDADSFRRNKDQIGTQVINQLQRVARRSGLS